jgi:ABC-2 type transport system permease protein
MPIALRKWTALYSIYFQESIAYRASMFIWTLTDAVPASIMPLVWLAAYATRVGQATGSGGAPTIAGFTPGQMVTYYMVMLLFSNFIVCHFMWDMAVEIKEGVWNVLLVRPVSIFETYLMRNLSWRVVRSLVFIPLFVGLVIAYGRLISGTTLYLGWELWVAVVLGHVLSFCFVFAMGLIALWVQEVHSIFGLYYIPMLFMSGQIVPPQVLPKWAYTVGLLFPFYYTTALPTEIAIGRVQPAAGHNAILVQILWIVICWLGAKVLWRAGIKQYTGVGM